MALQVNVDTPLLDASLNTSLNTSILNPCNGTFCFLFSRLIPGTTLEEVIGNSGTDYGPATFVGFNPTSCAVTLRRTTFGTPGTTITTVVDCTKIESVSFTS